MPNGIDDDMVKNFSTNKGLPLKGNINIVPITTSKVVVVINGSCRKL